MIRRAATCSIATLLCCVPATVAWAHNQGISHALLEFGGQRPVALQLDLAPIDLLYEFDLDADSDARLTWGEVLARDTDILGLLGDGVRVTNGNADCRMEPLRDAMRLVRRNGEAWVRASMKLDCPTVAADSPWRLHYDLFFDADPSHRLMLRVAAGAGDSAFVLSAADREAGFVARPSFVARAGGFIVEGFRHILSGYDHLAFLLLLVLPQAGRDRMRARLRTIAGIVTAFTVAHSLTLAAAMLGIVHIPARPVEVAIAASVVLAAIMNVIRPGHAWGWQAALAFGLLHGFGFAGALADLSLEGVGLWAALLSFNVGIELGQLLVVLLVLPILTVLSTSAHYRPLLVPAASLACAVLGVAWTAARLQA